MNLSHGDYTQLARDYAENRAGYAPQIPAALIRMASVPDRPLLDLVDVGAGTGIWTRQLARSGFPTMAIEPNAAMFELGRRASDEDSIEWRRGSAEVTGLDSNSCDLLTMASALHWTDFELASAEFQRVIRPGGLFAALWNTRVIAQNPVLVEIEEQFRHMLPHFKTVSSGRSSFCEGLEVRLTHCGHFEQAHYFEGSHIERLTPARYVGIWRSVNDARVQTEEKHFDEFLGYVTERVGNLEFIDAAYLTRVWTARLPI